mgnify:FL=1
MKAALTKFLDEVHNVSDAPYADAEEDDGGLGYRPGLVSSGSMTYAGLKSMIYADLDRDDPRVKGVLSFIKNNYTLEKNPGQEMKGYYYYLHALAKALDAWGHDTIVTADGTKHHWRRELIAELAERQLLSGSWINQDGRYMESMPDMVTAYCMIALKYALGEGLRARE